jgi:hypothetical protein
MKSIGMSLWIAGSLVFLFAAFGLETTVANDSGMFGSSRTYNIGLQQVQLITSMAGLTLFLSGSIIHALAALFESAPDADRQNDSTVFSDQIGSEEMKGHSEPYWEVDMLDAGVSKDGDQYIFGQYRYDSLSGAMRYARKHQRERA